MLDINEFIKKLLAKYGIEDGNPRMLLLTGLVGELNIEIENTDYLKLKEIYEANEVKLLSKNNTIHLKKEDKTDDHTFNSILYVEFYENGQNGSVLKSKAVLNDYRYNPYGTVYIDKIEILEFDYDGSIYFIYIEKAIVGNMNFNIKVKYYNPDTVKLFESEKEKIEVYSLLDDFCIHPDGSASDSTKAPSISELFPKIDEIKDKIMEEIKINKENSLKLGDK